MPRHGVRRGWAAAALLGAAALPPAACSGDDEAPPAARPSGGSSTGTGTAGGDGGAGGAGTGTGGAGTGTGGAGAGTGGGDCGNGVAEPGEACDGSDVHGRTCQDLGFDSGEVRCKPDCTFDTSGCSGSETCQDGRDNDGDAAIDCDDPDCTAACQDPCATPQVLPDPASTSGDTRGHAIFENLCSEPPGGPAAVYELTAGSTGFLDIVATPRTDADLVVSVRSACADVTTELGCNNVGIGAGVSDLVSVPITQGDRVYIVVSGADATQTGVFDLVARSRQTVCGDGIQDPTEECDVLVQTPNDGCSDDCRIEPTEVEPNNSLANANAYTTPFFGSIRPLGDQDVVRIAVPNGPTTLIAEAGDITSSACVNNILDSAVDILSSTGAVLATDDNSGSGLCAQAIAPALPAGTYYVRVKAPSFTITPTFGYQLELTLVPDVCGDGNITPGEQCDDGNTAAGDGCGPACRFELTEVEPNSTPAQARAYAEPWLAEITPAGDVDLVAVEVPGPSSTLNVAITDNGTGACEASRLDSYLEILGTDGTRVLASDDDSGFGNCSFASVTGLAAGTYFVRVRASDLSPGTTFFYRLNITIF